jgi:hypothetical protein
MNVTLVIVQKPPELVRNYNYKMERLVSIWNFAWFPNNVKLEPAVEECLETVA